AAGGRGSTLGASRAGPAAAVPPGLPQDLSAASGHGRTLRPEPAAGEPLAEATVARLARCPRRPGRPAGARGASLRGGEAEAPTDHRRHGAAAPPAEKP